MCRTQTRAHFLKKTKICNKTVVPTCITNIMLYMFCQFGGFYSVKTYNIVVGGCQPYDKDRNYNITINNSII